MPVLSKQSIRQLLAEGKIQKAIEELRNCLVNSEPGIQNEVVMQSSRYNRLREERRKGIITREEFEARVTRLTQNILDLLETIPDTPLIGVSSKNLPVIIIAMTREEAEQLLRRGECCSEDNIQELLELINNLNIQDIIDRYGIEHRDKWCPFGIRNVTVRDLLKKFVKRAKIPSQDNSFRLNLSFYTDRFFSDDQQTQDQILESLREKGGLFIIDSLSIFHLNVFERFKKYCDTNEEKSSIQFIVLPMDIKEKPLHKRSENKIADEVSRPLRRYYDKLCFSIRREDDKRRFLRNSPDKRNLKISLEKLFPGLYLSKKLGEEFFKPIGIEETDMRMYFYRILEDM